MLLFGKKEKNRLSSKPDSGFLVSDQIVPGEYSVSFMAIRKHNS